MTLQEVLFRDLEKLGYMLTDAEKESISGQVEVQVWNTERIRLEEDFELLAIKLLTYSGAGKITMPCSDVLITVERT